MSLWLVRAGGHGEQEQVALEENVITIGWNEFSDFSNIKRKEDLTEIYRKEYPSASKNKAGNEIGQIWRFVHDIKKGDLVALPLKTESSIALGEVVGDYEYKELSNNVRHIRRVKWLKTLPRSAFDQDLLYSFGAFITVCKIQRNVAKERVLKLLHGNAKRVEREEVSEEIQEESIDIGEYSQDQIVKFIEAKFKGHGLARLVDAILKAQGYITRVSPPGKDGGVDSKVRADQGLFVSWGGFNLEAKQEAKDAFFTMRLWDQGNILQEIFKYYEQFDNELKAELPLKRIWSLVIEE